MRYHTKPILMGVISYLPIYAVFWVMFQLPDSWLKNQWVQLLVTPFNLIMLPACGYIAARISKLNGLIVGAATGMLISVVTIVISASLMGKQWYGESLATTSLGFMLKFGFYSALGVGVGELHARSGWLE